MTDFPHEGAPHTVPPELAPRILRALDRSPSTIITFIDDELHTRWLSRSYTWITGKPPDIRVGKQSLQEVHPDDVERLLDGLAKLRQLESTGQNGVPVMEPIRFRIRRTDGTWQTLESLVHNLLDDPVVRGLVLVSRPVDGHFDGMGHVLDLLIADEPLDEVLSACAALMPQHMGTGALVAALEDGPVVGAPPGSGGAGLVTDDRWWRGTLADGRLRAPSDFAGFPDDLAETARALGYRTAWVFPLTDGPGEVMGAMILWPRYDGEPHLGTHSAIRQTQRLAGMVIGEHRRRHALHREAMTDPLTGLGNRSALRHRLDSAPGPVTVAILDLDDFKPVNDTFGHDVGDQVLCIVAERLVHGVRDTDLAVRLGGDEFVVVFEEGSSPEGSITSARRLARSLESPIVLPGGPSVTVGASLGVATGMPSEVVRAADAALYEVKRARRARRHRARIRPERAV